MARKEDTVVDLSIWDWLRRRVFAISLISTFGLLIIYLPFWRRFEVGLEESSAAFIAFVAQVAQILVFTVLFGVEGYRLQYGPRVKGRGIDRTKFRRRFAIICSIAHLALAGVALASFACFLLGA